jgi:hypothetical protein
MKSFNQFLNESYFSEERPAKKARSNAPSYEDVKAAQDAKEADAAARRAARVPTGAAANPSTQFRPQGTTTNVPGSSVRGTATPPSPLTRPSLPSGRRTRVQGKVIPGGRPSSGPAAPTPATPSAFKPSTVNATSSTSPSISGGSPSNTREPKPYRNVGSSSSTTKGGPLAIRPTSTPSAPVGSKSNPQKIRTNMNVPGGKTAGKFAKIGKLAGPASAALDTALSTADERSKGSGWARSLAKGATVAAGGVLGGTAGAIGGGGVGSAVLGTAGALAGGAAAEKAFDTVAGANAKERKAMATANRQRQAGTSVKGIGGQTSFSQKKPGGPAFMSTGVGKQRSTVQLAKTGVVQRGGQSVAGNLAFKGGKAVYKAGPSAQSLAKTSSNPLERVGRSLFAGAYKKSDAANAAKKLATARQSDTARNKALGVKFKPAG